MGTGLIAGGIYGSELKNKISLSKLNLLLFIHPFILLFSLFLFFLSFFLIVTSEVMYLTRKRDDYFNSAIGAFTSTMVTYRTAIGPHPVPASLLGAFMATFASVVHIYYTSTRVTIQK